MKVNCLTLGDFMEMLHMVTNKEIKYSQLQTNVEGSRQEDNAKHESNAGDMFPLK